MSRPELVLLAYTTLYNTTFCQRARHCCTVHYIYGTNIMCAYTLDVTRRSRTVQAVPHCTPRVARDTGPGAQIHYTSNSCAG